MLKAKEFADFLMERAAAKDGYIMCAVGQNPKKLSEWYYSGQYSGKQLEKARYWREHAERVWDCQGLADGYVSEKTGVYTNVRARNNYADWCGVRGEGVIPAERRVPGAAVFMHDGNYITHVGFLVRPVKEDRPEGDWQVVEARGVMHGVVTTRLLSRPWNRWGLMTKYFEYGGNDQEEPRAEYGGRNLKRGCVGADVAALQRDLIALGYSCGKYGADGEFGTATLQALTAFQRDCGLAADGVAGEKTYAALAKRLPEDGETAAAGEPEKTVKIAGGTWNVRTAPSMEAAVRGYVKSGECFAAGSGKADGWVCIWFGGEPAWVSAKGVEG